MRGSHAERIAAVHLLGVSVSASPLRVPCRAGEAKEGARGGLPARLFDEEVAQVDTGQAALRGRDGVEDGRVRRVRVAPLPAWPDRTNAQPCSGLSVLCERTMRPRRLPVVN